MDTQQLFNNLMALCEATESGFYFTDNYYPKDDHIYRIFTYRLVGKYNVWLLPDALNCRGTMFRYNKVQNIWDLVTFTMPKCFRLNENPIIQEQELSFKKFSFYLKHDGSLISTFIDANGDLGVKSKGSLDSPHAKIALPLLQNMDLSIYGITDISQLKNQTLNFELTSHIPSLRIVLQYDNTELKFLNSRDHNTGIVTPSNDKLDLEISTIQEIENHLEDMQGIEGYIVYEHNTDIYFKCKTPWYDALHFSKFSFSVEHIITLFLNDKLDDYRSIHFNDIGLLEQIDNIITKVSPMYNGILLEAEQFYNANKHLDRKTFAVNCKNKYNKSITNVLVMNMYLKRYTKESANELFLKHWRDIFKINGDFK